MIDGHEECRSETDRLKREIAELERKNKRMSEALTAANKWFKDELHELLDGTTESRSDYLTTLAESVERACK